MSESAAFTAIVAMADNRVIGHHGALPWHIPGDLRWFKATTTGHTVIMGRKTFQSIGKALPGRTNVVLSRLAQPCSFIGAETARNIPDLLKQLPSFPGKPFVIGGEEIYKALLPQTTEILLTRVPGPYEGDAYFPEFESDFTLTEVITEKPEYRIERWTRHP
jgi:dihydrofolate reductase